MNRNEKHLTASKRSFRERLRLPGYLKVLLKIGLSSLALWLVFRNIDLLQLKTILLTASWWWLIAALFFFNLSKWLGAWRLLALLHSIEIPLGWNLNLRLFYVGMFYNLFLPGGIGGDGYKLIYLRRRFSASAAGVFRSLLYDRLNGLGVLIGLAVVMVALKALPFPEPWFGPVAYAVLIIFIPATWLLTRLLFKGFVTEAWKVTFRSFLSQFAQLFSAFFILLALGVSADYKAYLLLFLLSSIATIIPITVGGIGLRELVFLWASDYADVDVDRAVALGLIFFLITAMSSLAGVFIQLDKSNSDN